MTRIFALLLTVALLAAPLGATVCAGHCARPQPASPSPISHCGSAASNTASAQSAAGPRLTAINPCGVKSVPTILKAGDDPTHLQMVQATAPVLMPPVYAPVFAQSAALDTSPPGMTAPHQTPLRI